MDVQATADEAAERTPLISVLEDERFKWRTVDGIAKDLNQSRGEVLADLQKLIDEGIVIRSTVPAKNGDDLYTTRKHYATFASPVERFLAAVRNRVT